MKNFNSVFLLLASAVVPAWTSASAQSDSGEDVSSLILNAQFDQGLESWSGNAGSSAKKGTSSNYVITCYGSGFDLYQTITGLNAAGKYTLKVQAFSRPKSNADTWSDKLAGNEIDNLTYIYANKDEKLVKLIVDEWATEKGSGTWSTHSLGDESVYIPNNAESTSVAFSNGMYENELDFIVGSDGVATIGIKNLDSSNSITYAGFDNFRLIYNGELTAEDLTDEMVAALVADIPTGDMNADVKAALDAAIANLQSERTAANYLAVVDAIDAANVSATAYANVKAALEKGEATELSEESRQAYNNAIASIKAQYEAKTLSGDGAAEVEAIEAALNDAIKADTANNNDLTDLIKNPQFEDGLNGWEGDLGKGAQKGLSSNKVFTSYGSAIDVHQTIDGLNPGIYKVQAQIFMRPTSNDKTWAARQNGDDITNETYLYANDNKKNVKLIIDDYFTEKPASGSWSEYSLEEGKAYVPNNSDAVSVVFSEGMYENEILVIVDEDGQLTFGVRTEGSENSETYIGMDNFRLSYVGATDVTSKIQNPQFEDGLTGWEGDYGNGAQKGLSSNKVITSYGGSFDVYQDIEGLVPGTYCLEAQAFSRPLSNSNTYKDYAAGKSVENLAYLYGGDEEKLVKLIVEESKSEKPSDGSWTQVISGVYVPDNSDAVSVAFSDGMYQNSLEFSVDESGKARIGIRNLATSSTTYVGYDNFRLTYISTEIIDPNADKPETASDMLSRADAMKSIAAQAVDHSEFDAVYETAAAVLQDPTATSEQLDQADEDLKAAFRTLLKTGQAANGQFNISALIQNAAFDNYTTGWKIQNRSIKWSSEGLVQASGITAGDKIYQTLKGMPAGKYTVKVQGFYQAQAWKQALYDREHGKEVGKAALFLNDEQKQVKSIFDDPRNTLASACVSRTEDVGAMVDGRGFPLLIGKVEEALNPGGYWTYLEAEVAEDGNISFGVDLDETELPDNWLILDNFRLYYGTHNPIVVGEEVVDDDTPVEVQIAKHFDAGQLYPFSAPCDIDGSKFKAVYEIGSLDVENRSASIFPVENVRAGIPCYVEFNESTDLFNAGETVLKPEIADTYALNWDGGVITPDLANFSWSNTSTDKVTNESSFFTTVEKQDLQNMDFSFNIENYQVQMFNKVVYTASSSSVVSTYNKVIPARRDLPHAVALPVPASKAANASVKISLQEDLSEANTLQVYNDASLCYVPNLIPGNDYYFAVESDGETLAKGKFSVDGQVRMMYAPSVYNLRDLGGYRVADGRVVRYGLIYRGGEVNGYHAPVFDDLQSLIDLGIGAELDLRYNDSYDQDRETGKSGYGFTLGDNYYFAGANDYLASHLSDASTLARVKDEFSFVLSQIRQGRGVHFHCVFGADRTGFFASLIEGLLGMDINQMAHDYEYTSFAAPAGNRNLSTVVGLINVVQKVDGDTYSQKYENFWLNNIGVSAEDIKEFRDIMLVEDELTAINEIAPDATLATGSSVEIQDVYQINGVKVSPYALTQKGLYIVRYNDGTSKKVIVK